jgi:hypothetical protein
MFNLKTIIAKIVNFFVSNDVTDYDQEEPTISFIHQW